jgi:hypothetical protein
MTPEGSSTGQSFTYDLDESWSCTYRVVAKAAEGGQPVIAEVAIRPRGEEVPRGGVTSRLLREVKLGEHFADLTAQLQRRTPSVRPVEERTTYAERETRVDMTGEELDTYAFSFEEGEPKPRRGRPGLSNLHYAKLAQAYVAALGRGSRRPTADAAAALSYEPSHVRDGLNKARDRGLLTRPETPGRPGGQLTGKAELLLFKADMAERAKRPPSTDEPWWKRRPPEE